MRLILIGCGYSGGSTMARAIGEWLLRERGATAVRVHDHWVYPYIADQDPSTCFVLGPAGIVPREVALPRAGTATPRCRRSGRPT